MANPGTDGIIHIVEYSVSETISQISRCREELPSADLMAIFDFEFLVLKRTTLRKNNVRGLSVCIVMDLTCQRYARVLDYNSFGNVADKVIGHLGQQAIAADVIATADDIEHLRSATSDVTTPHPTDRDRIIKAFATLSAVPSVRVACLAIQFNSRTQPIILSHGIELAVYQDLVTKALNNQSNSKVLCSSRSLCDCTLTPYSDVFLPASVARP